MKALVKKEVEKIIRDYDLDCSIKEFKNKANWVYISIHQQLSLDFIKEFKDKVNWYGIFIHQQLSEAFIYELSFILKKEIFKEYFLCKGGKYSITEKRLEELREKEIINSRFEILDL